MFVYSIRKVFSKMESEINSLKQKNARLVTKIIGLESEKVELLKQVAEERARHEVENAKLKSRIEELERSGQILLLKILGVIMQLLSLRPK